VLFRLLNITVAPLFKTIKRQREIQGILHPAEANLGYFLAWFQSLQLPSTQSESPLALISFSPKFHVLFKSMYSTVNRIVHFSIRIIGSLLYNETRANGHPDTEFPRAQASCSVIISVLFPFSKGGAASDFHLEGTGFEF
jgi:hypothetical protein